LQHFRGKRKNSREAERHAEPALLGPPA
jgi:hypothetical protein